MIVYWDSKEKKIERTTINIDKYCKGSNYCNK